MPAAANLQVHVETITSGAEYSKIACGVNSACSNLVAIAAYFPACLTGFNTAQTLDTVSPVGQLKSVDLVSLRHDDGLFTCTSFFRGTFKMVDGRRLRASEINVRQDGTSEDNSKDYGIISIS